jgi:hypothetical protein
MVPAALGAKPPKPPALLVGAVRGKLHLTDGKRPLVLEGGWEVDVSAASGLGTPHPEALANWLTGTTLPPADQRQAERLAGKDGIPFGTQGVTAALQQRVGDRTREARRFAIRSLAAIDDFPTLVDALGDVRFNDNRQTAVAALRAIVRHDQARAERIEQALSSTFPMNDADWMMKMLYGFPAEMADDGALRTRLVDSLESQSVAIRELAVHNLRELYGKDFGYSATEAPPRRAAAVKQWRALPNGK